MSIDSLAISFTCGSKKKVSKTVQELKMAQTGKKVLPVNEKQQKFRKRV